MYRGALAVVPGWGTPSTRKAQDAKRPDRSDQGRRARGLGFLVLSGFGGGAVGRDGRPNAASDRN